MRRFADGLDSLRCRPLPSRLRVERFKLAQDQPETGFENALVELRAGQKTGRWSWYVFPQLAGLGRSKMSQIYGIESVTEAFDYLRDPLLRLRLLELMTTILSQHHGGVALRRLMGSPVDLLKLVSSMTLFGFVARQMADAGPTDECGQIAAAADEILLLAQTEGYPPCRFTLAKLQ